MNIETRTYTKEEFLHEYKKLKRLFQPNIYKILQDLDVTLAGGALTSLFTNRDINDLDIYFKSYEDFEEFCLYMFSSKLRSGKPDKSGSAFNVFWELDNPGKIFEQDFKTKVSLQEVPFAEAYIENVGMTNKSVMFSDKKNPVIQCITFDVFEDVTSIFKKFDFSINMIAFNFKTEEWVLHKDALKHCSQKVMVFNTKTDYPVISLLRSAKYSKRDYAISRKELMKLGLAISQLKISSWDEAKDHLSGMYGTNVEEMFSIEEGFSFDKLMEIVDETEEKFITSIATDSDSARKTFNFNLQPKSLYEVLSKIRQSSGRELPSKVYGVCPAFRFFLMDKTSTRYVGLGSTSEDVYVKQSVCLFLSEHSASNYFNHLVEGGYDSWDSRKGAVLLELEVSDITELSHFSEGKFILLDNCKFTVKDVIKAEGDVV